MENLKTAIRLLAFKEILAFIRKGITRTELEYLHDISKGQQFGIISAYRGNLSRNENKRRHTELAQDLNELGVSWEVVQGTWGIDIGEKKYELENSFFCYGIDWEDLKQLAINYEQEAVIFKPYDGTVNLLNLQTDKGNIAIEVDVETNVERPREKEEHYPTTRFRDTELTYEWSPEIPFIGNPLYIEDVERYLGKQINV